MRALIHWGLALLLLLPAGAAQAGTPIVAVASSLQFAFPELMAAFRDATGQDVRVNYGASGNFRRQISQGAPFELFLSADEVSVLALHEEGRLEDAGTVYAIGRLVWLQRRGEDVLPDGETPLAAVRAALDAHAAGDGRERIALANPEHAPYGVAARQALQHAGLWAASEPLRVMGENVAQAAQFALASDSRGGLVAQSLAVAPAVAARSEYVPIPDDWHARLAQRMALVEGAGDAARALYAWLQQDAAREILARYGFEPPVGFEPPARPDETRAH
ncbi:molybdate ABC transporter substrate-binding protein [Billgrantia azerbaijanica]|nr:molybdate ABC transporter substrate-binding protein [Halomonas azerbaijanica]